MTRPSPALPGFLAAAFVLVGASPAGATDYSREVRPGITSFKRLIGGSRPQNIYAVRADLSSPNIGLHASEDVRGTEWYVDTLTFAENVGAIAAINGDWSCTTCTGSRYLEPLGLAISGGDVWNAHIATDTIGNYWGYIGCDIDKRCDLTRARPLNHSSMADSPLRTPTVYPLRYQNAIGANGAILIRDGAATTGCFDSSTTNPRSAACIESDGVHLWIVGIDGRGVGGGTGMSCDQVRTLLLGDPFYCWDAVMLDGGGSTTLVVEDTNRSADCNPRGDDNLCVKNNPSDGSPRRVANHLGITWRDTADARCSKANGKWCDGGQIHTCEGGIYRGAEACPAGEGCQEDGSFAFCVDARCPEGNGLRVPGCVDATNIAACNDGDYAVSACASGTVCGSDSGGSACMDPRCSAGPNSSFCAGGPLVGSCTAGIYAESACAAGSSCASDSAGLFCADDRCPGPEGATCAGDVAQSCARGVYTERDCSAEALSCRSGACVSPDAPPDPEDTDTDTGSSQSDGWRRDDTPENPPGVPGGLTSLAPSDCGGCATGSRPLGYAPLLALGALVWGRRKRGATS